ncbi:hypothetical protein FOCC_FOCC000613 [Frankliniella occidentalis]|nr:hypothetical protein FOCC_FOCC000613 [Frankliniella occidentalis]
MLGCQARKTDTNVTTITSGVFRMAGWAAALLLAVAVLLPPSPATAYMSDRHSASNAILGISTACSSGSMNVTVRMRHPFRGILYSRGFPLECSTARDQHHKLFDFLQQRERDREAGRHDNENQVPLQPAKEVTLSLPASECGIRVVPSKDGEGLWLQTSVVVQLDRHLQQAADQTRTVSCHLPARESSILLQPLQSHRTGRQRGEDIPSVDFAEASSSSSSPASSPAAWQQQQQHHWQRARALMEILTTAGRGRDPGVLTVGEEAALIVTSHLPGKRSQTAPLRFPEAPVPPSAGVGSRVTDCFAHDGAGEGMERLSDGRGCPTDRLILPQLREFDDADRRAERCLNDGDDGDDDVAFRASVTAAKFAAFKFPDRSRLHLRCQLQLCRGACAQGERGEILGRLQVFNSVEVLAPGIEGDDRLRLDELTAASGGGGGGGAVGEKTFCLSPPKMALALAALGSLLLCAVAAALWSLLHRRHRESPLGSAPLRALLRRHFLRLRDHGSHGSSASLGERNVLVRVQDSPFGHPAAPSPGGSPGGPGDGRGALWQDKLFH